MIAQAIITGMTPEEQAKADLQEDRQGRLEDRLIAARFAEWNGIVMLDGLLIAAAAINASTNNLTWGITFSIVLCSFWSAIACVLCLLGQRRYYLDLVNMVPTGVDKCKDEQKKAHYIKKWQSGFYRRITEYSQRGTRACYIFLFFASILTLLCFVPKHVFDDCPLQPLIFK